MSRRIKRCHVCKYRFEQRHSRQTFCPVCRRLISIAVRDHGYVEWSAISRSARMEREEARQGISKAAQADEITGGGNSYPGLDHNGPEWA